MRRTYLHLIMLLIAILFGSCNEEIEKELTTGKNAVTIEIDEERGNTRTVSFTGGTAYGEGLYDGSFRPTVGAEASDGYEIDYFYGGPSSEPQKYNHTRNGSSVSFDVFLNGMDHHFKCKFKEKKRTLTLIANPTSGGTVSSGGTYKVKTNIPISATAKSGYTFNGWTVTSGDAKIANASSASTTVQLQSTNSTLTANFKKNEIIYSVKIKRDAQTTGVGESYTCTAKYEASVTSSDNSKASVSFVLHGIERQWTEDNGTTTWEQADDVSTSGEPIVEDWCDGSNGIYSYSSISWTGYTVTVNGHTISSSTFKSASFEIAGGKISVII